MQNMAQGRLDSVVEVVSKAKREVGEVVYYNIDQRYCERLVQVKANEMVVQDLDKYSKVSIPPPPCPATALLPSLAPLIPSPKPHRARAPPPPLSLLFSRRTSSSRAEHAKSQSSKSSSLQCRP